MIKATRGLIGLIALVGLFALAGCGGPAATPTVAPQALSVQLKDFKIEPSTTEVHGSVFSIAVNSLGPTPHNFNIRNEAGETVAHSEDLRTGESATVPATLSPGAYTIFCAFPGHESLGMHVALTVTAP